ncbi:DNA polymerase II small subunit, partial [archaeon]|nr:DNA polymerase II small subunit [archaeon]
PSGDDPHVISRVPDIFHTGDLHSFALKNYRGVQLISSSTFQGQTAFMDRVGHQSNPGKVTRVRLDSMRPSVLDLVG